MSSARETQPASPSRAADSDQLERLAHELAALGAETPGQRKVKQVAPWVVSLMIHAGVVILAAFITWTVTHAPEQDSVLIVADFNALNYEPVASAGGAPTKATEPGVQDRARTQTMTDLVSNELAEGVGDPADLLGSAGSAGAGALSQFAPGGPRGGATFVGVSSGSNARRIVYVIDASGSMIANLQTVVEELGRSLENLSPQQSFAAIFFQKNEALVVPPADKLIAATPREKTRALEWIRDNVVPIGRSNPLAALEAALAFDPDVIFVLSEDITGSGEFEIDQRDLLARLNELNPIDPVTGRRATQINCIQFLEPDPLRTLEMIARAHGGANGYRLLTKRDLGLEGN